MKKIVVNNPAAKEGGALTILKNFWKLFIKVNVKINFIFLFP